MKILSATLLIIMSFGTSAAIHCKTSDDFKWDIQISIDKREVTYRISGATFHSPVIKNSDGSYNLFDNIKGSEVFIRNLVVDGNKGTMFGTYVDLKKSEILNKNTVPLTCVDMNLN